MPFCGLPFNDVYGKSWYHFNVCTWNCGRLDDLMLVRISDQDTVPNPLIRDRILSTNIAYSHAIAIVFCVSTIFTVNVILCSKYDSVTVTIFVDRIRSRIKGFGTVSWLEPHSSQTQKSNATSGFRCLQLRKSLKRKPARFLYWGKYYKNIVLWEKITSKTLRW